MNPHRNRLRPLALTLAAWLVPLLPAQAAILIYTTQETFLAATANPGVDTFDDLTEGAYGPSLSRNAGDYLYSVSAADGLWVGGIGGGSWLSTDYSSDSIIFSGFDIGVRAIGGHFFGSDIDGFFTLSDMVLTAANAGGSVTHTIFGATTASFVGFVSDSPLTSVTVKSVEPAEYIWPTVNDLTLATAIPEPANSTLLIGTGLMVLVISRRRAGLSDDSSLT